MTKSPKPPSQPEKPTPAPPNVMLPPIDATPEEIAQALVRRRPEAEDSGDS